MFFFLLSLVLSLCAPIHSLTAEEALSTALQNLHSVCVLQQQFLPSLERALSAADFERSKFEYAQVRPPYEQIEVLSASFPDVHAKLDALPYQYPFGEDDERFVGFHAMERAIFREQNATEAFAFYQGVVDTVNDLCDRLSAQDGFEVDNVWKGLLRLAIDVPARKISSDEETWSDLSLMVFQNNYKGIWIVVEPFLQLDGVNGNEVENMRSKYDDIRAIFDRIDPENGFEGERGGFYVKPYSTVTVEQRRRLQKVAYEFWEVLTSFKLSAIGGNIEQENDEDMISETDAPELDEDLFEEMAYEGILYLARKCTEQLQQLDMLKRAIANGAIETSIAMYPAARAPYEQIEVLAGDFALEDAEVDARPYAFAKGERDEKFGGFHKIEHMLYRDGTLKGAKRVVNSLEESIQSLCNKLENPGDYSFSAKSTWAGMISLAYEMASRKISSEEETFSDLSLLIFRANSKGIQSQFEPFLTALPERTVREIEMSYSAIESMLDILDEGIDPDLGFDFRPYSTVSVLERGHLSRLLYEHARNLRTARLQLSTTPTPSPSPTPSEAAPEPASVDSPDEDPVCFPADAVVTMADGRIERMDNLLVGDEVRCASGEVSIIHMFSHRETRLVYSFVEINLSNGDVIAATAGHFIFTTDGLVRAGEVTLDSRIMVAGGEEIEVRQIRTVRKRGLFNPHSFCGSLIVNGVQTSCYTDAVRTQIAHSMLAPIRALFAATGVWSRALEGGKIRDVFVKAVVI